MRARGSFPIIPCKLCGSQDNAQRKEVKRMLADWEREYPGRTESIFSALRNVETGAPGRSAASSISRVWMPNSTTILNPSLSRTGSSPTDCWPASIPGGKNPQEAERRLGAAARSGLRRLHRPDRGRRAAAVRHLSTRQRAVRAQADSRSRRAARRARTWPRSWPTLDAALAARPARLRALPRRHRAHRHSWSPVT